MLVCQVDIVNIILIITTVCLIRGHMESEKEIIIRANFTLLQSDLELLNQTKRRCLLLGIETNKSELIRAGIDSLSKLTDDKLKNMLARLPKPKVGRKKPGLDSD